jgi:hypothetical protein
LRIKKVCSPLLAIKDNGATPSSVFFEQVNALVFFIEAINESFMLYDIGKNNRVPPNVLRYGNN